MTDYDTIEAFKVGMPYKDLVKAWGLQTIFPTNSEQLVYSASLQMDVTGISFQVGFEKGFSTLEWKAPPKDE